MGTVAGARVRPRHPTTTFTQVNPSATVLTQATARRPDPSAVTIDRSAGPSGRSHGAECGRRSAGAGVECLDRSQAGARGKAGEQGSPDIGALQGMVRALAVANERREKDAAAWHALKTRCIKELKERFLDVRIHGALEASVPNILNVSFSDTDAEFLVAQLGAAGIAVSAKSAKSKDRSCAS